MPVMDEFKEERKAIKQGTPKEKISYFIDYYKWHVIITLAVIGFIASLVYNAVTRKEAIFYAAMVNALEITSTEEHLNSFAAYAGINTDEYDLLFDSSMRISYSELDQETITSSQKLLTYMAAGEIDAFIADVPTIEQYAYNDSFVDLRELLTQEQIARYEPYFFYIDLTVLSALEEARNDPSYDYSAMSVEYPNPENPAKMEQPVPIGIRLDTVESLQEIFYFTDGDAVLSIVPTSEHMETAVKYIDFLFDVPAAP